MQNSYKIRKKYCLDTAIFLATALTSYGKMISPWIFFRFFFFFWFYAKEETVKLIDDDICKRVIEFKTKNEIIKINRDYNNIDKRITDRQIRS